MAAFRSIVFSAALAGLIVGLFVTIAQRVGTLPLIVQAEVYERQAESTAHTHVAARPEAATPHDHAAPAWEPAGGLERNAYTAFFNIVEWVGFGLLLNGAVVLLRRPATWREGFLWGLGAFAAFVVAPGLGLPPELPGVPAAPLLDRQLWWVGTAVLTATGLALIAFRPSPMAAFVGVLLMTAPHLVGAPRLEHVETDVPERLSQQFTVVVTLTSLACWALLGGLCGHLYEKFSKSI